MTFDFHAILDLHTIRPVPTQVYDSDWDGNEIPIAVTWPPYDPTELPNFVLAHQALFNDVFKAVGATGHSYFNFEQKHVDMIQLGIVGVLEEGGHGIVSERKGLGRLNGWEEEVLTRFARAIVYALIVVESLEEWEEGKLVNVPWFALTNDVRRQGTSEEDISHFTDWLEAQKSEHPLSDTISDTNITGTSEQVVESSSGSSEAERDEGRVEDGNGKASISSAFCFSCRPSGFLS